MIEPRQLAVGRQRRDLEIDRAVGRVGVPPLAERVDHVGHRLQVLVVGGARRVLDRLDAERQRVLAKRLDVLVGVLAQRQARLRGAGDRLVVHVGEVHDVVHLVAGHVLQRAAQHVHAHEGAEVADVAAGVDGQAARVHAHGVVAQRGEVPAAGSGCCKDASASGRERLRHRLAADGHGQLAVGGREHGQAACRAGGRSAPARRPRARARRTRRRRRHRCSAYSTAWAATTATTVTPSGSFGTVSLKVNDLRGSCNQTDSLSNNRARAANIRRNLVLQRFEVGKLALVPEALDERQPHACGHTRSSRPGRCSVASMVVASWSPNVGRWPMLVTLG